MYAHYFEKLIKTVEIGLVGESAPFLRLPFDDLSVDGHPTRLGFKTGPTSIGFFSFEPFGKRTRK